MKYDLHHKPRWMPLSLHIAIENATRASDRSRMLEPKIYKFYPLLILLNLRDSKLKCEEN